MRTFLRRGWGQVRNIGEWRTSTKLMILLLVVAFLAIFVVSSLSVQNGVATVTRVEERILTNYASSVALQVDNQVLQYRHDAVQVATDPSVIDYIVAPSSVQTQNGAALLQRLKPVLTADPDYRLLLILDLHGRVVLSNEPGVQGQDYSDRDFFKHGKLASEGEPYISDISLAEDRHSQVLYVSESMRDALGRSLGVVAIRLSPDRIAAPLFANDLQVQHLKGFLISRDGIVLANSFRPSLNYKALGALDPVQAASARLQYQLERIDSLGLDDLNNQVAGATTPGFTSAHLVSAKETDVIGWAPVQGQRWSVMVSEDQAAFTADVQNLSRSQFFGTVILALIIGGLVIFAARMFETTERESLSDPLTGLANRRFFQEILLREMRRSQRSNQPLALVIGDIDHFKGINDTYGHNVGDEVLEQMAGTMLSTVRATDFVIRYGGEEFIILLPETRLADAVQVADKLRKTVGDTIMESHSRPGITLKATISLGVAAFPTDAQSGEQLVLKADSALYWAKQHGRNRVSKVADTEEVAPTQTIGATRS